MTYTREQYMKGEVNFEQFYGQFAEEVLPIVLRNIPLGEILDSDDLHFHDIKLHRWDAMHRAIKLKVGARMQKALGPNVIYSISDSVCLAKSAAGKARDIYQTVVKDHHTNLSEEGVVAFMKLSQSDCEKESSNA